MEPTTSSKTSGTAASAVVGSLPAVPEHRPFGVVPEAFWLWVDKTPDGCWEWTGYVDHDGYGRFWILARNTQLAHRVAYELAHGRILPGLQIDHLCFNRACVNPAHLEMVTASVNTRRSWARKKASA